MIWSPLQIKPMQLKEDCFWANTKQEKLQDEELFSTLKSKFASAPSKAKKAAVGDGEVAGGVGAKPMKKVKQPVVVTDGKILQAIGEVFVTVSL